MTTRHKHRFWRLLRIYFRRFRIAVWLFILLLLGTLIYLNQIGLPGFVKRPLLEKLRASGVDLEFSRLRLRWPQGIVAENVRFGQVTQESHPEVSAAQVQVQLNYRALAKLRLQVDSLRLRRGSIVWPMPDPIQTNRQLAVEDIQTDLELLPGDQWQLEHFTAGFAGARIQLSGAVTNASAVRDWKFLHGEKKAAGAHWQDRLRSFADTLQTIQFSAPPDLRLDVRGDAKDLLSFQVRLMVNTPGAVTPWGVVDDGKLVVRLFPGASNELSRMQLHLEAAGGKTEWASATNVHLNINVVSHVDQTNRVQCQMALSAAAAQSKWGQATNVHFDAEWVHELTNAVPLMGRGELICGDLETRWCSAREVDLKGELDEHGSFKPPTDPSWAWWEGLAPYPLRWQLQAKDFKRDGLLVTSMSGRGRWSAPELSLTNLHAELYDRNLFLNANLDVATRTLQTHLICDVDPHKVEQVLTPMARHWLGQFTWNTPPHVDGTLSLALPAWTNASPNWRAEVQPGLLIAGKFEVPDGGTFRGIPALFAKSSFLYSNMTWHLPDLVATRPEGKIELMHTSNDRTKDFYFKLRGDIDPMAALPLLGTNEARALKLFTFSSPPSLEAEIWGQWHHEEEIKFSGHANLKHFTFKSESIDALRTSFAYTNRTITFRDPEAFRGPQVYRADAVIADFNARKVYLTNGFSTGDPMVVARAIGKHIVKAIEPYQFLIPPTAHVHGVIPIANVEDADLYFDLSGGPFKWMKFKVPQISGEVHWAGKHLSIMDIDAQFYGGKMKGSAGFEFTDDRGTEYHFTTLATNVVLDALLGDLTTRTNHLEGTLEGRLTVKRGNLSRTNDVNGDGYLSLRDGLIWTIPIFGVFSGPLDRVHQGLGSSRAKEGEGHFAITNGVIYTGDTEIRSPAMRLEYRGSVDLDGNVNARVEAQVLRDVWLIGPIVSTVLWPFAKMFEYKVTGTLSQPKTELLYFGKLAPAPETELPPEKRGATQGTVRPP